jgi:RNA polymerase sigma-70 factor, ECF subfamily
VGDQPTVAQPDAAPPVTSSIESDADSTLVAAILRRDRKATAELVSRHSEAVFAYVRRRLWPRTDLVEDIVQDVFMDALRGLAGFAGTSSLRTWLLGIARHKVEDHYRDCVKQPVSLSEVETEGDALQHQSIGLEEVLDGASRQHKVLRVLEHLPDAYRAALMWRYWEKRSAREMAAMSGRTEKSIERLLARARQQFRRRWSEE